MLTRIVQVGKENTDLPSAFPLSLLSLSSTGVDSVTVTVAAKWEFSSLPFDTGASDGWRLELEAEDEGRVTRKPLRNNGTIENSHISFM